MIPPGPRLGNVVLRVRDVSKSFEGRTLFENLSFDLVRQHTSASAMRMRALAAALSVRLWCRERRGLLSCMWWWLQEPGAIVGVIGANGSGKSTLFNILAGLNVSGLSPHTLHTP